MNQNDDLSSIHDDDFGAQAPDATGTGDNTPPAVDDNTPEANAPAADAPPAPNPEHTDIEVFLSNYGVEDGIINTVGENGEVSPQHISELSVEARANVMTEIAANASKMTPDEAAMLKKFGTTEQVDAHIESVIAGNKEADNLFADVDKTDYDALTDKEILFISFLEDNPNATDEEIEEGIAELEATKFFDKTVLTNRNKFKTEQKEFVDKIKADHDTKIQTREHDNSVEIATAMDKMDSLANWDLDDNNKNELLSKVIPTDKNGDSIFISELLSKPENLLKAAYLFHNGENLFDTMETHYKSEVTKAYQKGRSSLLSGEAGAKSQSGRVPKGKLAQPKAPNATGLYDIHAD